MAAPANEALRWKLHEFNSGDGHEGPAHVQVILDLNLKERGTDSLGGSRTQSTIFIADAYVSFSAEMNIRFSVEDLRAFNRIEDAVQLPDGSGYAGTLNIYHEIHCMVSLHLPLGLLYFQLTVCSEMDTYIHVPRALLSKP